MHCYTKFFLFSLLQSSTAPQCDPIRHSKEPQYKRKPRDCIVPRCHAKMLIRLDNHLVAVHKLKRVFTRILLETRIKYNDVEETPAKMSIDESYSVFDGAAQHLLLLASGGASAKKTVYNHVLQMKKISEMAGGVKELFANSSRLRNIMTTMQKQKPQRP
ncbi:uncharacterized protein [Apostichopus japonicus]|uniref:uncharacterized protein isoform X1 n=1 Tax=Stichopus japonicus TaxID=307972 RepID=UPI003AB5415D